MINIIKNFIGIFFGFMAGVNLYLAGLFMDEKTTKIFYDSMMKNVNKQ